MPVAAATLRCHLEDLADQARRRGAGDRRGAEEGRGKVVVVDVDELVATPHREEGVQPAKPHAAPTPRGGEQKGKAEEATKTVA